MTQKNIRQNVKKLLKDFPQSRNDDRILVTAYLRTYHNEIYNSSFQAGLLCLLRGEIPRFETICRHSRSLQREFEHLRGTNRKQRMDKQEKVKQDQQSFVMESMKQKLLF